VDAKFVSAVPLYMELTDGKIMRLGLIVARGPSTVEQSFQLPKLAAPIKCLMINYNYDVLSTEN